MDYNESEFELIKEKIENDRYNSELYISLGDFYRQYNVNQAYICYEQAMWLAKKEEKTGVVDNASRLMAECREAEMFEVNPASIVILSYNAKDMMIDCLESIRSNCAEGSYEVVIVDNDSQDGIRDYLCEQKDIILQLNDHNTSFSEGCNQGAKMSGHKCDIMLLNNDTVVPEFALFYLRLALYSDEKIGAASPTSNAIIIAQKAVGNYASKDEWLSHSSDYNKPELYPNENRAWISGFALLIKRRAWDLTGGLDERFKRGNFEDTDYGFRLCKNGFTNITVHNSYIFHYGSVSQKKDIAAYNRSLIENENRLNEKLGIQHGKYMSCHYEIVDMMVREGKDKPKILEVGCGFGHTLSHLKYRMPEASVTGIDINNKVVEIGSTVAEMICIDAESVALPLEKESYDYLILANVIDYFDNPIETVRRLSGYLKTGGKVFVALPNIFRANILVDLLKGKFETATGMDTEARHHFTKEEMLNIFRESGFSVDFLLLMSSESINMSEESRLMLDALSNIQGTNITKDLRVEAYVFTATQK